MILQTKMFRLATKTLKDTVQSNQMCALWGDAGLGKTFSTDTFISGLPGWRVAKFNAPVRATVRQIYLEFLTALTGASQQCSTDRAQAEIRDLLGQDRDTLVVVDETQNMNTIGFEVLRSFWDRSRGFPLVLVGGPQAWNVISAEPMLRSRIRYPLQFKPLDFPEFLSLLPQYDAIFAGIDTGLAKLVYAACHGGYLRDLWHFVGVVHEIAPDRRVSTPIIKAVMMRRGQ